MQAANLRGGLLGTFVGDALAMPAHWYYSLSQLQNDHGIISGYVAPKMHLQGSILNLSSTGGGGRGSDKGNIVGDVINHGKRQYWQRGLNYFYHCTLQQGENTLEGSIARLFLRTLDACAFGTAAWTANFRQQFATFMTTPGSHNDTYASTYIRMFFANHHAGLPLDKCPDNDNHNVDAIDALTVTGMAAVAALARGTDPHAAAQEYLLALRKTTSLVPFVRIYVDMITQIAGSTATPAERLRAAARSGGKALGFDVERAVAQSKGDPMTACYIDSAFPAALTFLFKYADSPEKMLLASVNAGGENVARTSVLGTLVGLAYGEAAFDGWMSQGLKDGQAILSEIDSVATWAKL